MIESNDQSLEYVGYQVPRSELDNNQNDADGSKPPTQQGRQSQEWPILKNIFNSKR
jgi:hypothetical protein